MAGFNRTGNIWIDKLLQEYSENSDKSAWLDRIAELTDNGKVGKMELFGILEKIVENKGGI